MSWHWERYVYFVEWLILNNKQNSEKVNLLVRGGGLEQGTTAHGSVVAALLCTDYN